VLATQWIGKLALVAVPLVLIGIVVGGLFAAVTYNEGADKYLQPCVSHPASENLNFQSSCLD
jgi:hypothetical protein